MPDHLLSSFRARLSASPDAGLRSEIERAVMARREVRSGHADWGLLCEDAGLLNLAFREFQLALRDDPDDGVASFHLAQHYRERGDAPRAADILERLLRKEPAREEWLTLLADVLRDEDSGPRLRAALDRAAAHGLARDRALALAPRAPPPG